MLIEFHQKGEHDKVESIWIESSMIESIYEIFPSAGVVTVLRHESGREYRVNESVEEAVSRINEVNDRDVHV